MPDVPIFLGSIPGWITAGSAVTGLAAYLRFRVQMRKLHGDRLDALETENRQLRSDFDKYRRDCIAESDRQREMIDTLRRSIMELERK